jgi:alpha-D-xyloside xylohydrolase
MPSYTVENTRLICKQAWETLIVEAWGKNGLRVRATRRAKVTGQDWALLPKDQLLDGGAPADSVRIHVDGEAARIACGDLECRISAEGWLSFWNGAGQLLFEEYWRNRNRIDRFALPLNIAARQLRPIPSADAFSLTMRFEAKEGEKFFGLGQYQDPYLDKKGSTLELAHRNCQSSVPFALSNRGYGFLWNNPAIGSVQLARNVTEWHAPSTLELDYWVTAAATPAKILEQYTAVTGRVPMMPEHGLGFTQCKMRYRTQDELLTMVREHKRRGLPLDLVVADFFHWTVQGDFKFDVVDWPDVDGMLRELKALGIELMVSIWPTIDVRSENRREMEEKGLLIGVDRGLAINMNWMGETTFYDATNPEARAFVWQKAKANYFDRGIRTFWLDEAEPEFGIYDFDNYRYHAGPVMQVGNIYPALHAKGFYDGLTQAGVENPLNLVRAAWAGSQRYAALVWSGDIYSNFRALREQLAAGLSMGIAGIPWWTTDIGGFIGGDPQSSEFRELVVRWFEWGCFCPVFRLHGDRVPYQPPAEPMRNGIQQFGSGAANEVWSFGDEAYEHLKRYLFLRERLRPYLRRLMHEASSLGAPPMRPLFFDFPQDARAWEIETEYMFGPDLLVAPVMEAGQRTRSLYLPAGAAWTSAWTGSEYAGGQQIEVAAELGTIPLFLRDGARLPILERDA